MKPVVASPPPQPFAITKRRLRLLGLTTDDAIRVFFGGNALMSVVVLGLITIFLLREGTGFFEQNRANLEVYRRAGLEYVDFIRAQQEGHTALTRYLSDLRLRAITFLQAERTLSFDDATARLAPFDAFADEFEAAVEPLRTLVLDLTTQATALKTKFAVAADKTEEQDQLRAAGKAAAAAKVTVNAVNFAEELKPLRAALPAYKDTNRDFSRRLAAVLDQAPGMPSPELQARLVHFKELTARYRATFPDVEQKLETWDHTEPVPLSRAISAFIFGRQWLTASFWQDWYGIIPLLVGSLMVSFVALVLAVPLGVGAALYVSQLASQREQKIIKPGIEFISAIPSVVLGFFGIVVLGEALRKLSEQPWLSGLPGFPYSERLNVLTAGALLGLIAIPTIFTLAEDAINNVPRALKEASFALGASRWQTMAKIVVPASLSGIISAVLLGFGRVIGETMVVLLCAGNRIAIPDFTHGLAVFTEPVHTMTGIIAQEMGEVVQGSIHYRALFMVGLVLFVLSLGINYLAQKIVRRYRFVLG